MHSPVAASSETTTEWKMVRLRDLGKWSGGGTPSKANSAFWENGTIPWVSPKDMKMDRIFTAEDMITEAAVKGSATNLVPTGSILMVTRSGILRHTFPVAVTEAPVTLNQDLKALTLTPGALPKYVLFALKAFSQDILHTCSKQGTTVNSIETEQLLLFEIPLAPPALQKEIVDEIEKLLSRLDQAVIALKRIDANLKRYKAAVLKTALVGKLTEQWRKMHPDVEPSDQLLKRILAERRVKWESDELEKMKQKGIKPKNVSWKKKYKEPAAPDTSSLQELPNGWVWASPIQLDSGEAYATAIGPFGSNLKVSDYRASGVPLVFVRNIRSRNFSSNDTKYVDGKKFKELHPHWVKPGDVLITKMGAPPGDATSYPEGLPIAVITADCIKITLSSLIEKYRELVVHIINSELVKQQIAEITQGVAQQKISLARFAQVGFPLPPLKEQDVILEGINRRISIAEELEATIVISLKRAERVRQTILRRAFAGGL